MEFIWNDGGRSACGFVGLTGDCVTRAIAIGTGAVYRDVYASLGERALKSPRKGVPVAIADEHLQKLGWASHSGNNRGLSVLALPKGIVIAHVCHDDFTKNHLCTVIDHVVHDTWNPSEDDDYVVAMYWTPPESVAEPGLVAPTSRPRSTGQELNQREFEKILKRLRALDNTASNSASTEGEKHNALRMMQDLMLRHNLSRDDIVDDDNVDSVQFTRRACPLNSRRACTWEVILAGYVTRHIFPMVQYYTSTRGHRTLFWFYGPVSDVDNCIALFRELLVTIATSATLQYGGYTRGSGASYCEGYVSGLPIPGLHPDDVASFADKQDAPAGTEGLIHTRTLALKEAAGDWLELECDIRLVRSSRSGRGQRDPAAASRGKQHGASHDLNVPGATKRLN